MLLSTIGVRLDIRAGRAGMTIADTLSKVRFEKVAAAIGARVHGGGTMWSSMYAAYEDLSSHYQRLLDGLTVLHSTMRTPFVKEKTQTTHPAIIRDPVTGKKLLFVNSIYSERFVELSERESD